ncbi:MAG: NAD-dependent epimerase/dehydratase family protein [bacterium]
MTSRRDFLKTTALGGGALLSGGLPALARATSSQPGRAATALNILVLGGTGFIGPHLVRYAAGRGHRISIFTRGKHDAELPSDIVRLQGDRATGELTALQGKKWDAVVDDSANNPDWVHQSAAVLKDSVGYYLFTSSTGVFYPYLKRGVDEKTPVKLVADDPKDGSATFGVAKAKGEQEVFQAFGDRGIVVRPTYIVGPGDTSDRFPYWPQRLARGGEVLAPGRRDDPVQIIDVRDLAEFMIRLLEQKSTGIYNVAGPKSPLTAYQFYREAADALKANVKFTYVDDYDFLAEHKIDESIPWAMLRGNDDGMMSVKNDRAIAAGLTFRPLAMTVRDTLAWWPTVPEARRLKPHFTITEEKEAAALADWRKGKA